MLVLPGDTYNAAWMVMELNKPKFTAAVVV